MTEIVLIAHNLRSTHNVGSLLRTADGMAVNCVYLTGYTPYPLLANDIRLPHLADKIDSQINKTALGAQKNLDIRNEENIMALIKHLRREKYNLCALELSPSAVDLNSYKPSGKIALIVGREVEGIEPEILEAVDVVLQIPMLGKKESYNVVQAAAMALYHLRFTTPLI